MAEIAHGEIKVTLSDRDALAGLERTKAQFDRTMKDIGRETATAKIDAELRPFEQKLEKAKRKLRELQGKKAATIEIDGDTTDLDEKIAAAQLKVKRLDGKVAKVQIKVEGEKQALAELKRVEAANDRIRVANQRRSDAEAKTARQRMTGNAQEAVQVVKLQKEYARLTDQLERLDKKRPIGREARAKVALDTKGVYAQMELVKARLNVLGEIPPVHIKADIDQKGLKRVQQMFGDFVSKMGNKAAGIGDVAVRLGPFTASIRQLGVVMALLGPSVLDVAGSLGALIGVVGAGIAGAAAVGTAAVTGLGIGLIGFKLSLRNTSQEVGNARTAIKALTKAQEGGDPKKIAAAQKNLNAVMKNVSPLARNAAEGIEKFYTNWDKHTKVTQKNFGDIAKNGFQALNKITPMWAKSTNQLSGTLDKSLKGGFKFLEGGEFKRMFTGITSNFNSFLTPALHGLGALGIVFGRITESASKLLPAAGKGFDSWATKLEHAVQPGQKLDNTIKRLGDDARDTGRFFMALGRLLITVFGGGEPAGAKMLNSMTAALNRWNNELKTTQGQNGLHDFFSRATAGATALFHALAPLVTTFVQWATNLSPAVTFLLNFVTGATKAAGAVGALVNKMISLTGLSGPLKVLAGTLGAMWAVGKIGAFVSMLARAVTLMKELGAINSLKAIASGGLIKGVMAGAGAGAAGAEAGAAATAARTTASALAVEEASAGAATGAVAGLTAESAILTGGLSLLAAGAVIGGYKLLTMKDSADKVKDSIKDAAKVTDDLNKVTGALGATQNAAGQETTSYAQSVKTVSGLKDHLNELERKGKTNTDEYRDTVARLNAALQDRTTHQKTLQKLMGQASQLESRATSDRQKANSAESNYNKALKDRDRLLGMKNSRTEHDPAFMGQLAKAEDNVTKAHEALIKSNKALTASEAAAAIGAIQYQRGIKGFPALAGAAAAAVGRLAAANAKAAHAVGTKFIDPKDAMNVANSANKSIKSGVKQSVVLKIIADSSNADTAIARLKAARFTPKELNIIAKGGKEAIALLTQIKGRKLTAKQQRIAQTGGPQLLALIAKIIGTKIPEKKARVRPDVAAAQSALAGIISQLARITSKTVTVTTKHLVLGGNAGGAAGGALSGLASGGVNGVPTGDKVTAQDRNNIKSLGKKEMRRASTFTPTKGERTNGPRYISGDSTHPEFVISTHPAYRKRNKGILGTAAGMLGAAVPAFALGGSALYQGNVSSGGVYSASTNLGHGPDLVAKKSGKTVKRGSDSFKKREKKASASGRGYVKYIDSLLVAQDDWEQTVSQREAAVDEPETFLKETGRITDPKTGEDLGPKLEVDQGVVNTYKAQLQAVQDAVAQLLQVIMTIIAAIPQALQAISTEEVYRNANIKNINEDIHQDKAIIANHDKGKNATKNDKDIVKRYKERLKDDQKALGDEKDQLHRIREDRAKLYDDRRNAGFSLVEAQQHKQSSFADIQGVDGIVTGQMNDETQTEQSLITGGGSGGDGSGSGNSNPELSIDAQSAIASNLKYQALQSFGSNMTGLATTGLGTPGLLIGQQANPSTLGGGINGSMSGAAAGQSAGSMAQGLGAGQQAGNMLATTAAGHATPRGAVASPSAPATPAAPTVNVTNNYAAPPPDPHTWSKGVAFELGATV